MHQRINPGYERAEGLDAGSAPLTRGQNKCITQLYNNASRPSLVRVPCQLVATSARSLTGQSTALNRAAPSDGQSVVLPASGECRAPCQAQLLRPQCSNP